ncbi:hypothetical protein CALVIDRAFT_602996 [Calocera viscosa TUFC12733]|uniref:Uncharacterized protein n=1 Tax=Calocera viscosa (strain TUFC12733) TaxID=1330018 RepID=A0A167GCD9_CALVF|nr:hypothetical protein CALVIDRAFT_602996 [Calocera viscosa TUFC12733]
MDIAHRRSQHVLYHRQLSNWPFMNLPPMVLIGYEVTYNALWNYSIQSGLCHYPNPPNMAELCSSLTARLGTDVVIVRMIDSDAEMSTPLRFFLCPRGFTKEVYPFSAIDLVKLEQQFHADAARIPDAFKRLPELIEVVDGQLGHFMLTGPVEDIETYGDEDMDDTLAGWIQPFSQMRLSDELLGPTGAAPSVRGVMPL